MDRKNFRAFQNKDEFVCKIFKRVLVPAVWVRDVKSDDFSLITSYTDSGVDVSGQFLTWKKLLETKNFMDGSPCGVKI
ncbi:MAG: hypothetical protein IKT93_02200 [Clostridia bacterium]|nr:hypothetical protein [Clostridia bacterium]